MTTHNLQEIKGKSLAGVGALIRRQIVIKSVFFLGNIVLARILAPAAFGVYDIVTFIVQFFSTFGDVGLGAALIRKKGESSAEELSTIFWLQQILVWMVAVVVIILAPLALSVYPSLPPVGTWLIRSMAVSFVLMSFKSVPSILLERSLDFDRIAWTDIAEQVAYQITAITCAVAGLGVWSFIIAALVRGALGTIIIYSLCPWRPQMIYHIAAVRELIVFGIPYQVDQLLNFIKAAVTPLFVGIYAGAAAVGYVNWARNLAFAPLIFSASFERVAFPTFSKIHGNRELLANTVERSIRMMTFILFPFASFLAALGPEITHIVFTDKWLPGINAFYLFCFTPLLMGITGPMYSAILSLGKARILLLMTIFLIGIEWGCGILFIMYFGFTGIAMTQPISYLLFIFVYQYVLRKEDINVKILKNISHSLAAAMCTSGLLLIAKNHLAVTVVSLVGRVSLAGIIYIVLVSVLNKNILGEFKGYAVLLRERSQPVHGQY